MTDKPTTGDPTPLDAEYAAARPVPATANPSSADTVPAGDEPERLDLAAIDRLLAVAHREDDEPCNCDECMAYGGDDNGVDWYRVPVANRIAIRILDGADDRFAPLVKAFRDHDEEARS